MRSENKLVWKPAVFLRNTLKDGKLMSIHWNVLLSCCYTWQSWKAVKLLTVLMIKKKNKEERVYTKPKPSTAAGLFLQSYSVIINPVMGSCPLNCGAEKLMTLTFWELNDCVQWYSVSLDSRCFATVPHSWWTSCSESGFIRAAFSSWDSELFSDAILSVTVVGGGVAVDKVLPPLARSVTRNYCFMYLF